MASHGLLGCPPGNNGFEKFQISEICQNKINLFVCSRKFFFCNVNKVVTQIWFFGRFLNKPNQGIIPKQCISRQPIKRNQGITSSNSNSAKSWNSSKSKHIPPNQGIVPKQCIFRHPIKPEQGIVPNQRRSRHPIKLDQRLLPNQCTSRHSI